MKPRIAVSILFVTTLLAQSPSPKSLQTAVQNGQLAWKLSEPEDVRKVLGSPQNESSERDGGWDLRLWSYGKDLQVVFGKEHDASTPFVLLGGDEKGVRLELKPDERLALRSEADLAKLAPFTGFQDVDARKADLRREGQRLAQWPFNTRTLWPPKEKLPKGFDPSALMEAGANPGLGVRELHRKGVDGRGVAIGIIDQPLVKDHVEIADRFRLVAELEVEGRPPQMHGPAVTSLAAGARCGVAPKSRICYVSMAMWKGDQDNDLFIKSLQQLLDLKRSGQENLRVVSVSWGDYRNAPQYDAWQKLLKRAEAEGVLVITCDLEDTGLDYGLLRPLPGGDREKPEGYVKGTYDGALLVPGDGRTYAHHGGKAEFAYAPKGGMSWAAPYLAGLAALGFQVNPELSPARVRDYLLRSATVMSYGKVVNPEAFIRLCREDPGKGRL